MPTPLTTSGRGYSNPEVEAGNPKRRLSAEVEVLRRSETDWGKFEPVIRKWEEIMGRPAPEPTMQVSEEKRHELNPVFVEWMMSLPEGWVTNSGLTAMEELKILGNGVVPKQAELALRLLLGLEEPSERERERERVDSNSDCLSCIDAQRADRHLSNSPGEVIYGADWQEPRSCDTHGTRRVMLPTPTVSDTFTGNLASTQQKEGSMHSVTLPQAVKWLGNNSVLE